MGQDVQQVFFTARTRNHITQASGKSPWQQEVKQTGLKPNAVNCFLGEITAFLCRELNEKHVSSKPRPILAAYPVAAAAPGTVQIWGAHCF